MWHDARRQEKLIRKTMVDASKRGEKRRRFYEMIRADPDQFMQIHGRKATIHTDPNVAKASEDANVLRSWQGDAKIKIDRFDVRSHLDRIEANKKTGVAREVDSVEDNMEILCDFERYRILIINEYRTVGEKDYLKRIAEREYWYKASHATMRSLKAAEAEKKKKSAASKAAVGSYDDSEVVKGRGGGDDDSDSDSAEEEETMPSGEDLDWWARWGKGCAQSRGIGGKAVRKNTSFPPMIDLSMLDGEAARRANNLGETYGVARNSFVDLQDAETRFARDTAALKQIKREKLALSGKEARKERRLLKYRRQMIVGRGVNEDAHISLLAMIGAKDDKKRVDDSSSSSDSEGDNLGRTVFIRSLDASGHVEEDEEEDGWGGVDKDQDTAKVQGPALPNAEYIRVLSLAKRADSPQPFQTDNRDRRGDRKDGDRRGRDRSRSPTRRRSPSPSRSSSSTLRSRRDRRSRSRDNRRDYGRRRSRSTSRDRTRRRSRSRSRDRRRVDSPHNGYKRRRASRSPTDRKRGRDTVDDGRRSTVDGGRRDAVDDGRRDGRRRSRSSSREERRRNETRSRSRSRERSPSVSNEVTVDDEPMLSIHSSMSEEEKEKRAIENRKKRIRKTKAMIKQKGNTIARSSDSEEDEKKRMAEKIKQRMHKNLSKTADQLRADKEERRREQERERKRREYALYEEETARRERERLIRGERDDSSYRRRRRRSSNRSRSRS